jgi:hypothetical protein
VIAAVVFTPRKESQTVSGSVHVGMPDNNISEWAKLQQHDEYCQMLIKRIEVETKQEAKRQARLKEHLEFERDYGYYENLIAEEARKKQRENIGWFRSDQYT